MSFPKIRFVLAAAALLSACTGSDQSAAGADSQADPAFVASLVAQPLGQSGYSLALPATYAVRTSEGPDFTVYHFGPQDTTATSAPYGGLYFGNHPSEFEPEAADCQKESRPGRLLSSSVRWTVYKCPGKYDAQVIADSKSGEPWNEKVHAFGHGQRPEDLAQVLAILGTLQKQ